MVRPQKTYDPTFIAWIYAQLEKRSLRYSELVKACRRKMSGQTVNNYVSHGEDLGEIKKEEGRRGKYYLTSKGHVKLEQIRSKKNAQGVPWYVGDVDTPDMLWTKRELVYPVEVDRVTEEMPLPLPAFAALSGSADLYVLREAAESSVLRRRAIEDPYDTTFDPAGVGLLLSLLKEGELPPRQNRLGSVKLHKQARQLVTAEWARQIVKRAIRINILRLLDLHRGYINGKATKEPPPSLTLENILGFDVTFTVSYEGSKLRTGKREPRGMLREQAKDRMVGWLLIQIAYEEGCDESKALRMHSGLKGMFAASLYETIPLLEKEGLLRPEDTHEISQGGIVEVAFRYLQKAEALDTRTKQRDREEWIKDIESCVERCPRCFCRFGSGDRCRICRTPRRRDSMNVS
jgi:predicted transcriptional regulator